MPDCSEERLKSSSHSIPHQKPIVILFIGGLIPLIIPIGFLTKIIDLLLEPIIFELVGLLRSLQDSLIGSLVN